jgi:multiple sugar transport system ATP-binding protein
MSTITYDNMRKVYPDGTEAIPGFDLKVQDGEFMVFVGPSGCGKSTALRMTAGLEEITGGRLYIGDEVVNGKSPQERDIAMVFQDYALYPHMTVAENMGFALRMMKMPKDDIRRRVEDAAERLSLTALLDRRPKNLSGGQRQRVAMGRAIVREPQVFLMDEPLSNLDAKLRVQMRAEIAAIQHQLGVTTLYVTHDQVEAMTMGDRVAVMKNGRLMQCATPQELYEAPANVFVAGFIGSPKMNLFKSVISRDGDGQAYIEFGEQSVRVDGTVVAANERLRAYPSGPIDVADRHSLVIAADVVEMLGSETLVHFVAPVETASDADVRDRAQAGDEEESILAKAGSTVMCARLVPAVRVSNGAELRLHVDASALYFFDAQGQAIR